MNPVLPVLHLVAAHGQKRDQKPLGIRFRDPVKVLVDDALDGGTGAAELLLQAFRLDEAEFFLRLPETGEIALQRHRLDAEDIDVAALLRRRRRRDRVEALQGTFEARSKQHDEVIGWLCDEFLGAHAHRGERDLELATGVGELGGALGAVEGVRNLGFAAGEGNAIGEKPDHRNRRDGNDAGADR